MKHILIANNLRIDNEINKLDLVDDDEIILFNYLQPYFKYEKIRDFKNLTVFSRKRSSRTEPLNTVYAGMDEIKNNYEKFKKIIFHKAPHVYNEVLKKACYEALSHYEFLASNKIHYIDDSAYKSIVGLESSKSLSSGLIAYIYTKLNKKETDDIILIGFTSSIATRFHDSMWERRFFAREIMKGNCKIIR
jgi:hypothetical protein